MRIADVACGTGIWLLDVTDTVSGIEADGLDVDLNNVPPKGWLGDNVSFRKLNILEDLTDEYMGRYDVINVQFASSFVRDPHIKILMSNLIQMLSASLAPLSRIPHTDTIFLSSAEPGGYLQITDAISAGWSWITASGDRKPPEVVKFYSLIGDIFGGFGQWHWLENIEETFKDAGLEHVIRRRPKAKVSTLQSNMMNILLAQIEAGEMIAKHPKLSARAAEQREQREKAANEARELGTGMDLALVRCCGRKAA